MNCFGISKKGEIQKKKRGGGGRSQPLASAAFDRREPGLFKEEFVGTSMVALCSKT